MKHSAVILISDSLQAIGLKHLLQNTFSIESVLSAEISATVNFDRYDYIFVDSDHFAINAAALMPRKSRCVIVASASSSSTDIKTISRFDSESEIIESLDSFFSQHNPISEQKQNNLSQREIDVLKLVASGLINKEIAEKLNISINTVLTHRKNITSKLGIKSVSGLSVYAMMNGLIES